MSEKGKRGAAGGQGSSKAASGGDGRKFATALQKLASEFDVLCKNTNGVQDYEDLLSSQAGLKEEVQKGEHEAARLRQEIEALRVRRDEDVSGLQNMIAGLKQHHDNMMGDFGRKYKDWDADRDRHATDLKSLGQLQKELEVSKAAAVEADSENRKLRQGKGDLDSELKKWRTEVSLLKDRCDLRELELKQTRRKLDECQRGWRRAAEDLGILPLDVKNLPQQFEELSAGLHKLVWGCFRKEIPDPNIRIDVSGTTLVRIPQPTSNSTAAQLMRCALAEAVTAQELSRTIFTELYISDDAPGVQIDGLTKALAWLDAGHPHEAAITRCQLARAFGKSSGVDSLPAQAAERVGITLGPWLGDDQRRHYVADLEVWFSTAMTMWRPLQRVKELVEVGSNPANENWFYDEDRRSEYDITATGNEHGAPTHEAASEIPLAVLFPHIYTKKATLFHGLALFAAQPAVEAAKQEQRNQPGARASRASQRRNSHHTRVEDHTVEQPAMGGRKTSVSSAEGGKLKGSLLGTGSDLSSSWRQGSQVDGTRPDVSASASTRSQISGSGVNRV